MVAAPPIAASRWRLQVRLPRWAYVPERAKAAGIDRLGASPGTVILPLLLSAVHVRSVHCPLTAHSVDVRVNLYAVKSVGRFAAREGGGRTSVLCPTH